MKEVNLSTIIIYNGQQSGGSSLTIYVHLNVCKGFVCIINKFTTVDEMNGNEIARMVNSHMGHNLLDSYTFERTEDEWFKL
jgi:hypothetical protein